MKSRQKLDYQAKKFRGNHKSNQKFSYVKIIMRLVMESQVDIAKYECYPDNVRKTAENYYFDDVHLLEKEL